MRQINTAGKSLIKKFETFQAKAYLCPAKVWTIGYGHTGDVKPTDTVTEHQAEAILEVDLDRFERLVTDHVKVPLTENQFSALVSFTFNVGPGRKATATQPEIPGFITSTLLRKLNAGDYAGAKAEFSRWNKAGGKVLNGLTRRRAEEAALFAR